MAYVRFSTVISEDPYVESAVYCYGDVSGGFTTHVAARKRKVRPERAPREAFVNGAYSFGEDAERDRLYAEWSKREEDKLEPIGLGFDGETFNDPTFEDMIERLRELKKLGYDVPDYMFEIGEDEG